ncbi:MAG: UvrD-helicase domain-containing protein [Pirellulaceae bacterium]
MSVASEIFPSVIVQASAGSGKTFALTNHFLRLLFAGEPCETILATTFTRKAAGEILDRIMQRLNRAASGEAGCVQLAQELDIQLTHDKVIDVLRQIATSLHRIQIGTLDSFFNVVARAYSFELGLPVDWQVVESGRIDQLSEMALHEVIRDDDVRPFLKMMTRFDADRRIADIVLGQVRLYFDIYRTSTVQAWKRIESNPRNYARSLGELAEQYTGFCCKENKLQKVFDEDLERAVNGEMEAFADSNMLLRIHSGQHTYYRKAIESEVIDFYQEIGRLYSSYLTNDFARRTEAAFNLIDSYAHHLWPLQMQFAQLRFSDVPFVLQKLFEDASPSLGSRVDHEVRHLLLDEFQDTSPIQWRILRPIIESIYNSERAGSFFCVGDKKQAIYAWRGGVAEIFDVAETQLGSRLTEAPILAKSWRSSPIVIDSVNEVFQNLDRSQISDELTKQVFDEWQSQFPTHTTARSEIPGRVLVEIAGDANSDDSTDRKSEVYKATVEAIRQQYELRADSSIGVLVGSHDDIARILFELHVQGIPASAEGGNSLTDSASVNLILALLHLIDHPGDDVARFHLSHSPLAEMLALAPENVETRSGNVQATPGATAGLRRELSETGFGRSIERWANILWKYCTEREARRLEQLIDFAYNYEEPWTFRTGYFLKSLEKAKILDPSSDRVRVMTVHAAKGLEFDVVIAPFLGAPGRWRNSTPDLIYHRSNPAEKIDMVFRYASKETQDFFPKEVQKAFDSYRRQEIREQLCLLYVLMTRAISHLQLIVPRKTKHGQTSPASLLIDTLAPDCELSPGFVFESSSQASSRVDANREGVAANNEEELPFFEDIAIREASVLKAPSGNSDVRKSRPPSKRVGPENQSKTIASKSASRRQTSLDLGSAFHECLEQMEWWNDRPSESLLTNRLQNLGYTRDVIEQVLSLIVSIEQNEPLLTVLDRNRYHDWIFAHRYDSDLPLLEPLRLRIMREYKVSAAVKGERVSGSIDRLALLYRGTDLFGAEIIEFKTDRITKQNLTSAVSKYSPQLAAYRDAVMSSMRLSPDQIWCRLAFVAAGQVVEVQLD